APATGLAPLWVAQVGKLLTPELVNVKVPLPLPNATGIDAHPDPPVNAISPTPSPLKSPGTAEAAVARPGKVPTDMLVTTKVPSPLEKATGMEVQLLPPVSAMSPRPSPLKSP